MALPKRRDIFLATCLLESIEDENYRNTRKLLVEHHANPNLLIPESKIAAIHYAAGMENTEFAEAAMKLILKCNGNPNVQTIEGETPLHIAVIWNRILIVEMLLDHGADLSKTDNENNTPINHAITEKHYNLIPIFQNHIFEKKLQKRIEAKQSSNNRNECTPSKPIDTVIKSLQQLDITKNGDNEGVLTPNRTNFNFKDASPFLVNINCRRPKYRKYDAIKSEPNENTTDEPNKIKEEIIEISDSDDNDTDTKNHKIVKNLFELTQENVEKHLAMAMKNNRKDSLICLWRNKVNESRQRKSILPIDENEFEAFVSENTEDMESPSIESSHQSVDTVVPAKGKIDKDSVTEDSFFTADQNEDNDPELVARTLDFQTDLDSKDKTETIFQTQEVYEHVDVLNNIKFYEDKLLANPVKKTNSGRNPKQDVLHFNTSSESGTCTDVVLPSDYDTDDLRKELKGFGDIPGPITKNTKRLYLKRLIRYKRRPQNSNSDHRMKCNFSVELQRTMRTDIESLDFINEYAALERQMINSFLLCPSKNKNMREGNLKKSFIYLLIDPRISENLLAESQIIASSELWKRFLHSIFYVGKGKSSRPYAHLYDAIKMYHDGNVHVERMSESLKLDRIIEIWKANKGVICLPVFHNITPVEAYTREAAIIDCLGVENLTNIKRGDYYGVAKSWSMRDRKRLGVLLLYKAMQVFMVEGESQLRPNDIK